MGGRWWTLIVSKKKLSGAHTDHGRRPPVSPIKSIKSKLWKNRMCLKMWALPYSWWDSPRDKGYKPLPCPIDAFLGHMASYALGLPSCHMALPLLPGCLGNQIMEIVFWSTGTFLKIRAACGTWNCPHGDFIRSNNSIWCCRNLILMTISICNSPSSSKCLHWREISMEKVNLLKNVNFFCEGIKWDAKLSLSLCCASLLSTYCSDQYDIFTCSNADGKIYLLMETPHLPIHQLCLSSHRLFWLYSR